MTDIQNLKRLAEAATPGPWQVFLSGSRGGFCISTIAKQEEIAAKRDGVDGHTVSKANQLFLESANPSTILALIQRIEQLELLMTDAKAALDNNWFSEHHGEEYNNEDVIEMSGRIAEYFAAQSTKEQG